MQKPPAAAPAAPAAAPAAEGAAAGTTQDADKKRSRAERFGIPVVPDHVDVKAVRAARFGIEARFPRIPLAIATRIRRARAMRQPVAREAQLRALRGAFLPPSRIR